MRKIASIEARQIHLTSARARPCVPCIHAFERNYKRLSAKLVATLQVHLWPGQWPQRICFQFLSDIVVTVVRKNRQLNQSTQYCKDLFGSNIRGEKCKINGPAHRLFHQHPGFKSCISSQFSSSLIQSKSQSKSSWSCRIPIPYNLTFRQNCCTTMRIVRAFGGQGGRAATIFAKMPFPGRDTQPDR